MTVSNCPYMCSLAARVSSSLAFSRLARAPMIRVLPSCPALLLILAAKSAAPSYMTCWRRRAVLEVVTVQLSCQEDDSRWRWLLLTLLLTAGMTGTAGERESSRRFSLSLSALFGSVASLTLSLSLSLTLYHSLSLSGALSLSHHPSHIACSALSLKRLHNLVTSEIFIDEHINSI